MAEWTLIGPVEDDAPDGTLRSHRVGERFVAVGVVDGAWHAFADDCTHEECPLSDGLLDGRAVECSCHGARFDVVTGAVLVGPATEPIDVYPTRVASGALYVKLPEE